jgi:hypothetical protein
VVARDAFNQWKPQDGLAREVLGDAGIPADAPAVRKTQMGKLAEGFTGHTFASADKKRYDLRLLPTPLYRYPAAKTGVVDGAVFALVSEAGTDPEVLLVVEARETAGKLCWEYALGRFSDCEIHVSLKGKEVFSSIPSEANPYPYNPKHTYRTYQDKVVTLDGKLLRSHVNREAILHIGLQHPLVGLVDLLDRDHLDIADDVVLAAEVEHLLRLLDAADGEPERCAAENEIEMFSRDRAASPARRPW